MTTKKEAREAYLASRSKRIGTTDVAAILGLSKYANAYDIWLAKTGKLEDKGDMPEAARAGIAFEDGVLDWAEETILGKLRRKVLIDASKLPIPMGTELDAVVVATGEPVNAKTAGLIAPLDKEKWGREGTDEVPELYYVQAQVELLLTDKEIHHLPAFLGGKGFNYYQIQRNDEIISMILDKLIKFWEKVQKDIPPTDLIPSLEVVKRRRRQPMKTVEVDAATIKEYIELSQQQKDIEALKEVAQSKLLAAMGDAEATQFIEGVGQITFMANKVSRVDMKKLKELHADIYKECAVESSTRKMLVRKTELKGE